MVAFALIGPNTSLAQAEHPQGEHPQGVWGTAPACEAWRAGEERRPELQLYEIGPQWIQRHVFFCMIRPQMSFRAPDGRWQLDVVCGEDAREVGRFLTLDIREADALTVTWSTAGDPESFSFGPFERCGAQDPTG
jgi:hypothetical protein